MLEDLVAKPYNGPEFPSQTVLELACAAQRLNGAYLKQTDPIYTNDGKIVGYTWANKLLMQNAIDSFHDQDGIQCPLLNTNLADRELANEIKKYYRKLMFAAIADDNEFHTEVNSLLNSEKIGLNKFGYVACLPSVYARDIKQTQIKKSIADCVNAAVATVGSKLQDCDCEILDVKKSSNYDAYNVLAIIENKLVSWLSTSCLQIGPCVVQAARVKAIGNHWLTNKTETRLNYVKAFQ
jgi:hypothetical protein